MNERLCAILSEILELPSSEIRPDLRRSDVESWDSLNHLRLVTAIESEFGAKLSMDEIAEVQTPGALERIVTERAHTQPA
jgi:acyl carrier protein